MKHINPYYGQFKSLLLGGGLVSILFIIGPLGYYAIEDYSPLDAIYMTVITVATVGFQEVKPLSDHGKIFTIIMILYSLVVLGFFFTNLARLLLDGFFGQKLKDYKVKKQIAKLRGHVIVCGYGRNGFQACEELADHDIEFVIVEKRDHVINMIRENPERLFIQGDAASEEVLNMAQISKAQALITALPNDADNIYVVLTARDMNPNLRIISRASEFRSDLKLRRAGADNVIMPDRIGGQRMAKLVAQPDIVEFWEYVLLQRIKDVSLEKISCSKMVGDFENKSIRNLGLREKTGANIVGLKTEEGNYIFNPSPDFELSKSDQLFVLGSHDQIMKIKSILYGETSE